MSKLSAIAAALALLLACDSTPEPKSVPREAPTPTQDPAIKADDTKHDKAPAKAPEPESFAKDPFADTPFTLADALAGDPALTDASKGKLSATFTTTMGTFSCELFEDKAPATVANFVGLARGTRPWKDKKTNKWSARKAFENMVFHRVMDFMVQTGDPTGAGNGGPGYAIKDEYAKGLKHSKAGMLSMANTGPDTAGSQFFVTVKATPHLDGKHVIFGRCDPKVALEISKVKVNPALNHRPYAPVKVKSVEIARVP